MSVARNPLALAVFSVVFFWRLSWASVSCHIHPPGKRVLGAGTSGLGFV